MVAYEFIEAPKPAARKFGLFSVADKQNLAAHQMLTGIEWYADNCNFFPFSGTDQVCVGTPTMSVSTDGRSTKSATAFQVYTYVECAGINEFKGIKDRAVAIMNAGIEHAIELRLDRILRADTSALDYTSGTPSLARGLADLEHVADSNYAGVPTFATSRRALSLLSSAGDAVNIHGNRLETSLGSNIFGGQSINSGPNNVAPAAGSAWLWVMGNLTLRMSPMVASDPVFIQSAGAAEAQTLTITGVPTGGTYRLTFDGQQTAAIAYNANAAAIQTALVALSNVDLGDITVTGTGPFTFTFAGQYQNENVPQITAQASFTGGTAPAANMATTTQGALSASDNSYRVMVARQVIVDYDCFAGATQIVLPA